MKSNLLQDELDNIETDAAARCANLRAAAWRVAECEELTRQLRRADGGRLCIQPFVCAHTHGIPATVRVDVLRPYCADLFGVLVIAGMTVVNVHAVPREKSTYERAIYLRVEGFAIPIHVADYIGDASIFSLPHSAKSGGDIPVFLRRQAT